MGWTDIVWMAFVLWLTIVIIYQQRKIRRLRAILSSRCNSSPDKDSEPDNTTDKSSN